MMNAKFELFVIFKGQVQGVGFRYKTKVLAEKHGIHGTVRNLPDGSVELIAQNVSQDQLENFCFLLEKDFSGYIQDIQKKFRSPISLYSSFLIVK